MRTLVILAAAACAALLAPTALAASKARDGYWRSSDGNVLLVVSQGRVLAVDADVEEKSTDPANQCGTNEIAFVGPRAGHSTTSTKKFHLEDPPNFTIDGTIVSSTKITGTIKTFPGGADPCTGTLSFSVKPLTS